MAVAPRNATTTGPEAVRFAIGFLSLVAGAFWLVMALTPAYPRQAFAGAVVAAGGAVLLAWKRLRPPARLVAAGAAVGGAAGTAAGLVVRRVDMGGMFGWFEHRGWPFEWLERGGVADSPDGARRQAIADGWGVDPLRLVADAVVWSYTAVVLIVAGSLIWRAWRAHRKADVAAFRDEKH